MPVPLLTKTVGVTCCGVTVAATDVSIRIEYKGTETHIPAPEDFDRMMMPKGESVAALQASL